MTKRNDNDEDFLKDLSSSLADQVKEELDNEMVDKVSRMVKKKKKKKRIALKIFISVLCIIVASGAFLTFTPIGRKLLVRIATEYIYARMDDNKPEPSTSSDIANEDKEKEKEKEPEEELKSGEITENIDLSQMSETFKNAAHEDGVYNILLLGVEAIGYGNNKGHTDSIMIATINTNQKTLGLTSIMRDTYVTIPGFQSNRINVAYALGGVSLLYETIAENYGVRVDGSVLVDFDSFQQVIDDLGGVDIEITADEAKYLNTSNYISKKANRNLKPGVNHMNGNQALGYARVRKKSTLDGSHDDMGRTSRHRRVITAIFNKMKKSNPATLITMMNTVLPKVQTDVKKSNASSYLAELVELSIEGANLDTLRLPEDGNYRGDKINRMSVVSVVNWDESRQVLRNFLFASHEKPKDSEKKGK